MELKLPLPPMSNAVAQLRGIALFHSLEDADLQSLVERAKRKSSPAGRLVFREGEPADALYVVISGNVKIFLNDKEGKEIVLDTKQAGEYFGEMMLDHRPRSASVMTLEPTEFLVISREQFRGFLRRHPEAAEKVILNLIRVTRAMNERTRGSVGVKERMRQYVRWLGVSSSDPTVRRWGNAKRWVLGGLLLFALMQYYFFDVFLQIISVTGVTCFVK
jgi:CRP-like cAMP-binding protein